MKKVIFTIADNNNIKFAKMFENSLRKFHTKEELPLIIYDQKELDKILDPNKFYRSTPLFARGLMNDYDLVIKADADQIVTGKLDYLWNTDDYDVATVLNINRADPKRFGVVTVFDIPPQRYYNCGLVVMRSKQFVQHWWNVCNSYHFGNLQYREQDILNILCHYGNYNVRCLDDYDFINKSFAWWGLVSKGEWDKMIMKDGKLILPKGKDGYPDRDLEIKMIHWAGGAGEAKMNYRVYFNEEVIKHFDYLTNEQA